MRGARRSPVRHTRSSRETSCRPFAALLSPLLLAACAPAPDVARPSLLLVVFDTTRADHLSCYGHHKPTTPTVDRLAAGGLRLDSAWAQSSLTPVSAATFLTGSLPYRHGIRSLFTVGGEVLADDVPTLAELLASEGYATAGFVSAAPMGSRYGLGRGFEVYDDRVSRGAAQREELGLASAYQRRADATCDRALAWLTERLDAADEPFFLTVHFFDAHDPTLVPPRAFLERWLSFPLPADLDRRGHLREVKAPNRRIELYDAEIRYQDDQLARLVSELERADRLDDTVVCVVADHGEGLGDHDFWTHGLLWSEQLRVPWILHGPGVPIGAVWKERVRLVDLLPTVVELLDVPLPPHASPDGRSILALPRSPEPEPREVYAEAHHAPDDGLGRDPRLYSLTVGRWKYVHRPDVEQHELYDLAQDPGELTNMHASDHPVARTLRAELEARGAVSGVGASPERLADETLEMLRELGYL